MGKRGVSRPDIRPSIAKASVPATACVTNVVRPAYMRTLAGVELKDTIPRRVPLTIAWLFMMINCYIQG